EEKGKYEALLLDGTEELDGCEEEELCGTGLSGLGEKKRRLSVEQVKALEKNFEVENKLDPERKLRLAQDLGLQPRQVAVWFQNRRARWKTKQLERDYGALKARHDALNLDCDALRRDNEALLASTKAVEEERRPLIQKDGASDSDSSVVFNDETSPHAGTVLHQQYLRGFRSHCPFLPLEDKAQAEKHYLDEEFLAGEELGSSLFSEQQAPNFSWYCSDEWD
ncbi:hypothetical protein GW17_00015310, partial [Ensete ventricosum]